MGSRPGTMCDEAVGSSAYQPQGEKETEKAAEMFRIFGIFLARKVVQDGRMNRHPPLHPLHKIDARLLKLMRIPLTFTRSWLVGVVARSKPPHYV